MDKKSYKEGYRIDLTNLIGESKKACVEFLHWAKDNPNLSKYDYDHIEIEVGMGCLVYEGDVKWHMIKGLFYDFFDKNSILISIEIEVQYTREMDEEGNNPHYVPEGFRYDIHDLRYNLGGGVMYKTRTETEACAFEDAFKILEDKLNP